MEVSVELVPVSVGGLGAQPHLVGLRIRDRWPMTVEIDGKPAQVAAALLSELNPFAAHEQSWQWPTSVEPVAFAAKGDVLRLIYTAAVPMFWADPTLAAVVNSGSLLPRGSSWQPLLHLDGNDIGHPITGVSNATEIVEYWRQRLEETTAALLFLPERFTMSQLRDTYQSVWMTHAGEQINLSNFHKWAQSSFGIPTSKVDRGTALLRDTDPPDPAEYEHRMQAVADAATSQALSAAMDLRGGGVMLGAAVGGIAGMMASPALAATTAGLALGYQQRHRIRGRQPGWFTATDDELKDHGRTRLHEVYGPRPAWHKTVPGRAEAHKILT